MKYNNLLTSFIIGLGVLFSCTVQAEETKSDFILPHEIIRVSTSEVIAYMEFAPKEKVAKQNHAFVVIEREVLPYLDFLAMTKLAVGKYWKRSTTVQQDKIFVEFKKLLIKTYVRVFSKFDDLKVDVLPFKAGKRPDRALVKTKVIHSNGGTTAIDYKFRLKNRKWTVYDIKVEGISLVTNYRTSFSAEIARAGVDGLIQLLVDKNAN